MNRAGAALIALMLAAPAGAPAAEQDAADQAGVPTPGVAATYPEIPYYLGKLQEAQLDGERVRLNKIIHDAVVSADVSDRKVVKKMDPIVEKVEAAIAAGLDRPYLAGESDWLASAVDFYKRERLRPVVDVPEMDWTREQTAADNGLRISTFPDRILLHDGQKTRTASESSNIHEAVISPDGRRIAYFRKTDDGASAELWVVNTKNLKRKKIATTPTVLTLLFTPNGRRVLFQAVPDGPREESALYSVRAGGGKPRKIGKVRLLETTVAKGPHKGNIVVFKAIKHHLGISSRDCAVVVTPAGKEVGRIKDGPCR